MEKNKRQPLYEFSILVEPKALGFHIHADNLYIWGYPPEEAKAIADSFTSHYLLDGTYNDDSVERPADDEGWYEFFDGKVKVCRTMLEETTWRKVAEENKKYRVINDFQSDKVVHDDWETIKEICEMYGVPCDEGTPEEKEMT